jgi:hypothetical protein
MMSSYSDQIHSAEQLLELAMKKLGAEISTYPTPISGCDAQFNHLLEQRSKIRNALHALETGVFVPTPRMPSPSDRVESR